MGFGVPLERWFRNELAAYMRDILTDRRTRGRGIFAPAGVEDLVNRYEKGARHLSHQIWALLCFETWARQWLDR
jgi:asparagine synthase (glutamine-hydrolysing)